MREKAEKINENITLKKLCIYISPRLKMSFQIKIPRMPEKCAETHYHSVSEHWS